jgi:YVTN family beta-propeller protein
MSRTRLLCLAVAVLAPALAVASNFGFVGMSTSDSLAVLDLDAAAFVPPPIDLLPFGNYPYDATMLPDGSEVWICGASGDGIVVIDTETHAVITTIDLGTAGEYPVNIAFDAFGTTAYVSARDPDPAVVVVVDVATHTPTGETVTIPSPYLGAGKGRVRPSDGRVFVVDWYGDLVFSIDPATLTIIDSAAVGDSLWDLAIHPSGSPLYIIDRGTDQVHVVDAETLAVVTSIPTGDDPWGIDITPGGKTLFIANDDSSSVTVIDTSTNTVETTIGLGAGVDPRDVDINAAGTLAYVTSGDISGDDGVFVIDIATLTQVDFITISGAANSNVIAVAPEPFGDPIFFDGFESGDTTAWTSTVP